MQRASVFKADLETVSGNHAVLTSSEVSALQDLLDTTCSGHRVCIHSSDLKSEFGGMFSVPLCVRCYIYKKKKGALCATVTTTVFTL